MINQDLPTCFIFSPHDLSFADYSKNPHLSLSLKLKHHEFPSGDLSGTDVMVRHVLLANSNVLTNVKVFLYLLQ